MFPHFEESSVKIKSEGKKVISHFRKEQVEVIMVVGIALMENTVKRGKDLDFT